MRFINPSVAAEDAYNRESGDDSTDGHGRRGFKGREERDLRSRGKGRKEDNLDVSHTPEHTLQNTKLIGLFFSKKSLEAPMTNPLESSPRTSEIKNMTTMIMVWMGKFHQ